MKRWIFTLVLLVSAARLVTAQDLIYATKEGSITFFSKAPLEDIEARNDKIIALLNAANNEIAVRVPVKQFQFRNKLMQEHFNENYMETGRFPYATFKGSMNENIDLTMPGTYEVSATGVLNIHGVNQKRTLKGKLRITDSGVILDTQFDVLLADHKIKIPRLVFNKIAEKIAVTTSFTLSPPGK